MPSHSAVEHPASAGLLTTYLTVSVKETGKDNAEFWKHKNVTKPGTADHKISSSLKLQHPEQLVFIES